MDDGWLPPHPYVPRETARHPEDLFEPLKGVEPLGPECPAWRHGLRFYRAGYFWEAHEMWEAVWMALPEGPERRLVQASIQQANARLKERMGQARAAARLRGEAARWLDGAVTPEVWGAVEVFPDLSGIAP